MKYIKVLAYSVNLTLSNEYLKVIIRSLEPKIFIDQVEVLVVVRSFSSLFDCFIL